MHIPLKDILIIFNQSKRVRKGFSMIELLVVIGVIAVLVSIVVGIGKGVRIRQESAQCAVEMGLIATKLGDFKNKYHDYPRSLSAKDGEGVKLSRALFGKTILVVRNEHLEDYDVPAKKIKSFVGVEVDTQDIDGEEVIVDPWGNPFYYRYEEPYALNEKNRNVGGKWENPGFILISAGPDGYCRGTQWRTGFSDLGINEKTGEFDKERHMESEDNFDNIIYGL